MKGQDRSRGQSMCRRRHRYRRVHMSKMDVRVGVGVNPGPFPSDPSPMYRNPLIPPPQCTAMTLARTCSPRPRPCASQPFPAFLTPYRLTTPPCISDILHIPLLPACQIQALRGQSQPGPSPVCSTRPSFSITLTSVLTLARNSLSMMPSWFKSTSSNREIWIQV